MKTSDYELIIVQTGERHVFHSLQQVETLLRMGVQRSGGWALPEDSKYEFTKEHGLVRKRNTRKSKSSDKI